MTALHILIYFLKKQNTIPIKIPVKYFKDISKSILKLYMEMQGTKKPKFLKINYVEELTLSDLNNYPQSVTYTHIQSLQQMMLKQMDI